MSGLLNDLRERFEGKIPFQGQRLADRICQETFIFSAIIAWLVGYFTDSLFLCMSIFGASIAAVLVICVPAWPMYRKHPVIWLPNLPSSTEVDNSTKTK